MSRFVLCLLAFSLAQAAFGASTNYEKLLSNDDGSVTIVEPRFNAADGGNLPLSSTSDTNGVCRLYGYAAGVANALTVDGDYERTVIIGSEGRFAGFRLFSSTGYYNSKIASLMCTNGGSSLIEPSKRYERLASNDDGSVTIVKPAFGSADGTIRYFSTRSNLDGLCRLYGFPSAIANSLVLEGDYSRTVVLGQDSKFAGFVEFSSTAYYNYGVASVMCQGNSAAPGSSSRYTRMATNDDGTTTIIGPTFGYADGSALPLSANNSNFEGVCKLYGFSRYVDGSALQSGDYSRTVVIGQEGAFSGYVNFSPTAYYNRGIDSLICYGSFGAGPVPRPDDPAPQPPQVEPQPQPQTPLPPSSSSPSRRGD